MLLQSIATLSNDQRGKLNMNMNCEDEFVRSTAPGTRLLPYHAPRLVGLGSVQALVKLGDFPGSDGGPGTDCAFGA